LQESNATGGARVRLADAEQRFPTHRVTGNSSMAATWPIALGFAFLYSVQALITALVTEKEEKLKETMTMMGL